VLLARTGYTGEDGFEIFAMPQDAGQLWADISTAGASQGLIPAGLAARDTLRLEAGMPLYGNELSRDITPYDAGLGRAVRLDKPGDFVGRAALAARAEAAPERQLVGLVGQSRRVPRHGYDVLWDGAPCGTVTSGAPSPTLGVPIAMAYVRPDDARQAADPARGQLAVDVRGRAEPARLVELPFYRRADGATRRS
jgi:aminomethyltransferase